MRIYQRLFRQSVPVVQSELDAVLDKIPFEVVGRSEEGKRVREIVWARGLEEAREFAARIHSIRDKFLVNVYELIKDQTGGISYAWDGRPIRKWE